MEDHLYQAIQSYGMNPETLIIESELPGIYHSDYHYKIRVEEKYYSARFISNSRYDHDVFLELTDNVLEEQMKYIDFLRFNGIPFMRRIDTSMSNKFVKVTRNGKDYRFLLFEWIDGKHITHCTESVCYKFGLIARKLHDISLNYDSPLPKESHSEGSNKFIFILQQAVLTASISEEIQSLLHDYFLLAKKHMDIAFSSKLEFIMQSDLNPLNVLWDNEENIIGIVDFEHIGYGDRIEGLAWLIKWYSRTKGLESHDVSPRLTESLLSGYGVQDYIGQEERKRLSSLLWLTGCLNWGFVDKTKKILETKDKTQMEEHLVKFYNRGVKLSSLISN